MPLGGPCCCTGCLNDCRAPGPVEGYGGTQADAPGATYPTIEFDVMASGITYDPDGPAPGSTADDDPLFNCDGLDCHCPDYDGTYHFTPTDLSCGADGSLCQWFQEITDHGTPGGLCYDGISVILDTVLDIDGNPVSRITIAFSPFGSDSIWASKTFDHIISCSDLDSVTMDTFSPSELSCRCLATTATITLSRTDD